MVEKKKDEKDARQKEQYSRLKGWGIKEDHIKEATSEQARIMTGLIPFNEWVRSDLRVAEIREAVEHPKADKLYILGIDLGDKKKTIVAGLRGHYSVDELIGKKIVVFNNLEPAEIKGVRSEGMLLAAVKDDKVVLVTPEKDIAIGAKIS